MAIESKKRLSKIARQKLAMRSRLWPNVDVDDLWHREKSDGWTSVPRPMLLLMQVMDSFSKGKPVSSTYLDLWLRTYDDSFVVANKHREMAFSAGFSGERAVRTWTTRMRTLENLRFIDIKDGPNGPISYVLLHNPYRIVRELNEAEQISTALYNALMQRMIEIGASDLDPPKPTPKKKDGTFRTRKRRATA